MKWLRAGRCRLYLPGFEHIFHQTIGGYSILAIPTLPLTIGGGVGMAGCHTLLNKKRSPKSFDSEDL
ncbi:hypothetical protein, partial [Leyella stercorea]|uniref:hypothetical protein n=1 Tax=Leyella stercorea TaxID=363265 RepID=UPI00266DD551